MKVYLPSWNGDIRLIDGPGDTCILKLHEPTPGELIVAGEFLRLAAKQKWWDGAPPGKGEPYRGKDMELRLDAPIAKVSGKLIGVGRPKDRTLTAIKFSGGRLEVVEGGDLQATALVEETIAKAKASETKTEEAAAASVKRPTPSCPQCQPGSIGPATEVLEAFLTPEQHEQWARERAILVNGGLSGHRYVVAHRHSALARRVGRICFDADDGGVMHFHDWSVPPEEEVLAAKLVLERAEPWLRNEATCLGGRFTDVYKNPFGGGGDGTESAAFAMEFGGALMAAAGVKVPGPVLAYPVLSAAGWL